MNQSKLGKEYNHVSNNYEVTTGILDIFAEYKMAETIWGKSNCIRHDSTRSFWDAWSEILILANQEGE